MTEQTIPANAEDVLNNIVGCAMNAKTVSLTIGTNNFTDFTMVELHSFFNAIMLARVALTGIYNQPRFSIKGVQNNRAGDAVEGLLEFLDEVQTTVCKCALLASPTDKQEKENRAWIILKAEADCEGDIADFTKIADVLRDGAMEGGSA